MKVAFWTLGIFVIGLLGLVLINLFGNITVTNQLNYTTMKNAVEASMYDALDKAHFSSGFCLCTDKSKEAGKWKFKDDSEYELKDITYENGDKTCVSSKKECVVLEGEYRIDKKVFAESVIRRFAEMVNNNKNYRIVIQDIIEYPPKVSVRVDSKDDEFLPTDKGEGYTIVNQMDAIIETWNGEATVVVQPTATPKTTPSNPTGYPIDEPQNPPQITPGPTIHHEAPTQRPTTPQSTPGSAASQSTPGATPNTGGCFLAGTKIAVLGGYRDIDKIMPGTYVLTYNEKTGKNEYRQVIHMFELRGLNEELYTITTDDVEFSLTHQHRVYTERNGKCLYIAAEELQIGDVVMYSDGKYHQIAKITHIPIEKTVYNLEIDGNHNFYVGEKNILVHNMRKIFVAGPPEFGQGGIDNRLK